MNYRHRHTKNHIFWATEKSAQILDVTLPVIYEVVPTKCSLFSEHQAFYVGAYYTPVILMIGNLQVRDIQSNCHGEDCLHSSPNNAKAPRVHTGLPRIGPCGCAARHTRALS